MNVNVKYIRDAEGNIFSPVTSTSSVYNSSGETLDTILSKVALLAYPVGSYYWSSVNTNPGTLFGGTWVQVKDKFVLAAGDSYAVNATGGTASVAHTHGGGTSGATTLTVNQIPKIGTQFNFVAELIRNPGNHNILSGSSTISGYNSAGSTVNAEVWRPFDSKGTSVGTGTNGFKIQFGGGGSHTHSVPTTGSTTVATMPPYVVAYCFRRTA